MKSSRIHIHLASKQTIWFGLLALMVYSLSIAASTPIPLQIKFKPILISQMEKLSYINTITQDNDGFLWFGAIQGLARYDGYSLKTYQHQIDDPSSLSHNWVKSLMVDSKQQLWAVTLSGLCRYLRTQDAFDCITYPRDRETDAPGTIYAMFEDSIGRYWVSTGRGIRLLDPHTKTFRDAPVSISRVLIPAKDKEDNFVHQAIEDKQGNIWFGLEGNGLIRYHFLSDTVTHFQADPEQANSLPSNKIREIFLDRNGTLWIGSLGGGISRFDPDTDQFTQLSHSASEKADTVWAINQDSSGILWIGDGTGVHLYDPDTGAFSGYTYKEASPDGPGNYVARDIFLDNASGIWVGYFPSGIDTVDPQASQFLNFRHDPNDPESIADGGVLSTQEDPSGNIWVGCGFGLSLLDRSTGKFKRYVHNQDDPNSISGSTVLDLAMSPNGDLWIGAWDRGLNRKPANSDSFQRFIYDPSNPNSLYGREPWATYIDSHGTLWVGTEKGVSRYRPDTNDFVRVMPPGDDGATLNSLYTRHIYEDSQGTVWISSFNGLYGLDPSTNLYKYHYRHTPNNPTSISSNQILTTFEDTQGNLWVGTNGSGPNILDRKTGEFKHFNQSHGLPNLTASGIIEDDAGSVWVSTFQGLARYNKTKQSFSVFDKREGPLGNLYNRNSPAKLSSGELVFGSSRGLTVFNPSRLEPNTYIPPVAVTEFSIFNAPLTPDSDGPLKQSINTTNHLELSHQQSVFSFEFAALSFRSPDENQYAYRMSGFESQWNYVGNRRAATYTNLDPGRYTFEVKASNNSGIWNEKPTAIAITIKPPYWRSPWAYLLYIVLVATILFRAYSAHKAHLIAERKSLKQERAIVKRLKEIDLMKDEINRELDKKVAERTEELSQEHQRLIAAQSELQTLNEKLTNASVTDQLTQLKNRRFLHQVIAEDTAIIGRHYEDNPKQENKHDLTFAILDLDKFKSVNDQHGHRTGDEVLVQISQILRNVLRESDYIVRWGGEEFVIVIRYLPRTQVTPIIERLLETIRQHLFVINDELTLRQTCSIGIAAYPFYGYHPGLVNWEQVVNLADKALYYAKESGRNCWVWIEGSDQLSTAEDMKKTIDQQGIGEAIQRHQLIVRSSKQLNQRSLG